MDIPTGGGVGDDGALVVVTGPEDVQKNLSLFIVQSVRLQPCYDALMSQMMVD